ncbi:hypothetical protein A8H40_16130 [Burkholderia multivorans]|nr:hypothetical protein A8H40_16130 [Burkholderia multivorans]RSB73223.1 hypothetical protein EGT33_18805 [Burkholderia multivorans]
MTIAVFCWKCAERIFGLYPSGAIQLIHRFESVYGQPVGNGFAIGPGRRNQSPHPSSNNSK